MKVGVAQIACSAGDIVANSAKIVHYVAQAAQAGCRVVVFPEMSDTGYDIPVIQETASFWTGPPFSTIQAAAVQFGLFIICGISEREGTRIYNTLAIFSPEGRLTGKYRKTLLFSPMPIQEDACFTPGSHLFTLPIGDMVWGFSICYDLRFPELYRLLALQGTEVLVNCAAWPAARASHWQTLTRARAIENQAYLIGANHAGRDDGGTFCGRSCIIAPSGEITGLGAKYEEQLVVSEVTKQEVDCARQGIPVLRGRRSDLYGDLGLDIPGPAQVD